MKVKAMGLIFIMLLSGADAYAEKVGTGNDFLVFCGQNANDFSDGFCLGYISAIIQSVMVTTSSDSKLGEYRIGNSCFYLKDSIPGDQTKKIVFKYLDDHPEKLHLPILALIIFAMEDAFSCPGEG